MIRNFIVLTGAIYLAFAQPGLCASPDQKKSTPSENEACAQLLPADLKAQITKDFVKFRLLRVNDYLPEDIESEEQYRHGNKCLAAASGDYFGNKSVSYAFLLYAETGETLVVVAKRDLAKGWAISELTSFNISDEMRRGAKFNYYVNTLDPGKYPDIGLDEGGIEEEAKEPGWVETINSKHAGIIYGAIQSTGIAYFFIDGKWLHNHLID